MAPSTSQSNNTLIMALVILASVVISAIVALAIFGSPDNAVVAGATGQIITLVTLISGVLVTLKVTTEAKVAAIESKAVSEENAQSIAVVAQQTNQGLEGVNQKVDGHLTALTTKIDDLMQKVATLEKDKAIKEVADAHTETSTDKIITAMQAAVFDAAALAPPVGSAGGTPVIHLTDGQPTVEAPILVVPPNEKGKP